MALPIIFIHKGDSFYLKYSLLSAKKFNPKSKIILLGENISSVPNFIDYYPISGYQKSALEFKKIYRHLSTNNEDIERFCFERWFILRDFLKKNSISSCLVIDSDVLLYTDVSNDLANNYLGYDFAIASKTCANVFFLNKVSALDKYCKLCIKMFDNQEYYSKLLIESKRHPISDMTAFRDYSKLNKNSVGDVCIPINGAVHNLAINQSNGYIFDKDIVKIDFNGGLPQGYLIESAQPVLFKSIHFTGPTKFFMKYYYKGHVNYIDIFFVRLMIKFRDKVSPYIPFLIVRKFLKKFMLKLGF